MGYSARPRVPYIMNVIRTLKYGIRPSLRNERGALVRRNVVSERSWASQPFDLSPAQVDELNDQGELIHL
jgi:hypothetical protein